MRIDVDLSEINVNLGNNGIVLVVREEDGTQIGRLRIGQATGEWTPGKTHRGNGHRFDVIKLVELIEASFPKRKR